MSPILDEGFGVGNCCRLLLLLEDAVAKVTCCLLVSVTAPLGLEEGVWLALPKATGDEGTR